MSSSAADFGSKQLIVVKDDPPVDRARDLPEDCPSDGTRLLSRRSTGSQRRLDPLNVQLRDRPDGSRKITRKHRNIFAGRRHRHPGPARVLEPLPGQRRLPVTRRSNQENRARLDRIQHIEQPRATNDSTFVDGLRTRLASKNVDRLPPNPPPAPHRSPEIRTTRLPGRLLQLSCKSTVRYARGRPRPWRVAATGAEPSAPVVVGVSRLEALCQGVVAREHPIRQRNLPSPRHAELQPQRVAVCFRRSRRDPELDAYLFVRATSRDQFDDLLLTRGDR